MKRKNICIVGYPKSGNTWLTRLVAKATNSHVVEYLKNDASRTRELASDVNKEIRIEAGNYNVYKLHEYPQNLEKRGVDDGVFIYVYRNVFSVLISSFFYFQYGEDERFVLKRPESLKLKFLRKWTLGRLELMKFCFVFLCRGVSQYGTVFEHKQEWFRESEKRKIYFISYEQLIEDTEVALKKCFNELKLVYEEEGLKRGISEEAFSKRKEKLESSTDDSLTFGRKFNLKFLRAGTSDDWKRFLGPLLSLFVQFFSIKEKLCQPRPTDL